MKHASVETLTAIAPLLRKIRMLPGMQEKKHGVFYRRSKAFLHFHEEGACLYADVRLKEPDFDRMPASSAQDQRVLFKTIQDAVDG